MHPMPTLERQGHESATPTLFHLCLIAATMLLSLVICAPHPVRCELGTWACLQQSCMHVDHGIGMPGEAAADHASGMLGIMQHDAASHVDSGAALLS